MPAALSAFATASRYPRRRRAIVDTAQSRTIFHGVRSTEGAVMRRHAIGIGCGARGRGSQPRTREAPGPDRGALGPFRREPAGLGLALKASSQETRTRGTEIAAMARREAPRAGNGT